MKPDSTVTHDTVVPESRVTRRPPPTQTQSPEFLRTLPRCLVRLGSPSRDVCRVLKGSVVMSFTHAVLSVEGPRPPPLGSPVGASQVLLYYSGGVPVVPDPVSSLSPPLSSPPTLSRSPVPNDRKVGGTRKTCRNGTVTPGKGSKHLQQFTWGQGSLGPFTPVYHFTTSRPGAPSTSGPVT